MEGNGRKLAWVAIALSVLALAVSFSGRMQSRWMGYSGQSGYGPMMNAQPSQQGQGQFNPQQGQVNPQQGQANPQQGQFGRRRGGQFGPQQGQTNPQQGQFGPQQGMMGQRGFGPGAFFMLPFMLFGKLIKLVFVVLLIWLGFRLIRGRGFRGPWGRGPGGHGPGGHGPEQGPWNRGGPDQPSQPGPEQPPYTGETTQI